MTAPRLGAVLLTAVAAARADTEGVPEALVDLVGLQLARVRSESASPAV